MPSPLTILKLLLIATGFCYIGACAFLYINQAKFLFPGAFQPLPAEVQYAGENTGFQPLEIAMRDGTHIYKLTYPPKPGQPVIFVFHGNGNYPESFSFLYRDWIEAGYGIAAPAARGYPRSSGKAEGEAMLADTLELYDDAAKRFPGHTFIVFGQSLGTSSAVHVAANRPVEGVVLVSPFNSMLSLVQSKMPWFPISLLLKSPFRSDLDIANIKAPILILHGDRDDVVPISSARQLVASAKSAVDFEVVAGAGHGEGLFETAMIAKINAFLGGRVENTRNN